MLKGFREISILAKEWYPTKNKDLITNDLAYMSGKRYGGVARRAMNVLLKYDTEMLGRVARFALVMDNCLATTQSEVSRD